MRLKRAPRTLAIDTVQRLDTEIATALYRMGVRTVFRYLDRLEDITRGRLGSNLTPEELDITLDAGLCVSPVQYYSTGYESQRRGLRLSAAYGAKLGAVAAANARALDIPDGCTIWRDLEGVVLATPEQIVTDCIGWAQGARGYEAGLYYGAGLGSTETGLVRGEQLWGLPYYRSYWRAASAVPEIPHRGPCVVQGTEQTIHLAGTRKLVVDFNMICLDYRYQADRAAGRRSPGRFMVVSA